MSWSSSPTPFSDAWSQVSDKWQRPSSRSSTPPGLPPPSARTLARVSRSLLPRCPDPPGQPHPFRSMGVNLSLPRSSPPGLWPPLARAPQQGCLPLRHHQSGISTPSSLSPRATATRTGTKLTVCFSYSNPKTMTALDIIGIVITKGYSNSIPIADFVTAAARY